MSEEAKILIRILEEKTDDEHGITLTEIISQLSLYGITAERKSIYSDIQLLNNAGYEILSSRTGKSHDYRLVGGRNYQLAEVKLMVDAIQSTRFITHKKTAELIKMKDAFRLKAGEIIPLSPQLKAKKEKPKTNNNDFKF